MYALVKRLRGVASKEKATLTPHVGRECNSFYWPMLQSICYELLANTTRHVEYYMD